MENIDELFYISEYKIIIRQPVKNVTKLKIYTKFTFLMILWQKLDVVF